MRIRRNMSIRSESDGLTGSMMMQLNAFKLFAIATFFSEFKYGRILTEPAHSSIIRARQLLQPKRERGAQKDRKTYDVKNVC